MPTFDPTLPVANSPISSSELRDQLNALNDQFTSVQNQVNLTFSHMNDVDTLDTPFTGTPTAADLETIRAKLNELISALYN